MNRTSLKQFFPMAVRKKNYFRQNGAPKFIQKNRVKWLMNWQHDATMKYYWTATTIAFIAHRQENEKEIVFYCYWRASNGIHFPWLENGFGMPFCFLNKSKGKGDKIPVWGWPIFLSLSLKNRSLHPINWWNSHVTLTSLKWGTHVKYVTSRP